MATVQDVFISYKSDDAEAVRDVVEILRANGVRCWFAEYSISLSDWLTATDAWIDQTLQQAVLESRHVLVFSSQRWHKSDWCLSEHDSALTRHGVDNLSIIRLAPCESDTRFHAPPHVIFDFNDEDPLTLCHFLSTRLGRPISLPPGPSPLGRTALLAQGPFAISLCCDPLKKLDRFIVRGLSGNVGTAFVRCTFAFHPRRTTGVALGLTRDELSAESASRTHIADAEKHPVDRVIYREYAQRAAAASAASGIHVFGLHLLSNPPPASADNDHGLEGATAFGISKIQQTGDESFVLGRDYSLRLDNGPNAPVGELLILFETYVRSETTEQAMIQLSQIAPYFDRVAASVRYHGKKLEFVRRHSNSNAGLHATAMTLACLGIMSWLSIAPLFSLAWFLYGLAAVGIVTFALWVIRELLTRLFLWPTFRITVKDT